MVAAAFRLRNIVNSHIREAQTKACGYQNMYYDTVSGKGGQVLYIANCLK